MQFPSGSRVLVLPTREKAVILEWLEEDLALVQLMDNHEELPVQAADLRPLQAPAQSKEVKLAVVPASAPDTYELYLLNASPHALLYEWQWTAREEAERRGRGRIESSAYTLLSTFAWEALNRQPLVKLQCWQVLERGTGKHWKQELRLRAKRLAAKPIFIPLLERDGVLLDLFSTREEAPPTLDLKEYTREQLEAVEAEDLPEGILQQLAPDTLELAEFNPVKDLHIEALVEAPEAYTPAEILRIQLQALEVFLDKAYRLGLERVFVIHGLGKGVLRRAVADRLRQRAEVQSFKNEFHPSFGYGATEVRFR